MQPSLQAGRQSSRDSANTDSKSSVGKMPESRSAASPARQ